MYTDMSFEELQEIIAEKYGEEWTIEQLEEDPELLKAYIAMLETGM